MSFVSIYLQTDNDTEDCVCVPFFRNIKINDCEDLCLRWSKQTVISFHYFVHLFVILRNF